MQELEHPIAFYRNKENKRVKIRADELNNDSTYLVAKTNQLYDQTEQIQLEVRGSDVRKRHFYRKNDQVVSTRTVLPGESNTEHDKRRDSLMNALSSIEPKSILIKLSAKNDKKENFTKLCDIDEYRWGAEVHRILDSKTIVRHDIFGMSLEIAMSIHRPSVAIEVINTHYPDEQTFSALLQASENFPLIVLFDWTKYPGTFVKVNREEKCIQIRKDGFYIINGKLYKGLEPQPIKDAYSFKLMFETMVNGWEKHWNSKR